MSQRPPATADRRRTRDSTILLTVAVFALMCSALSLGLQRLERIYAVTASATVDGHGRPLPGGPRTYQ
jgi:hypothetical protein